MPEGDITSESIIPAAASSRAIFLAKEPGVAAGIDIAGLVFRKIDPRVKFSKGLEDGQSFKKGDVLAEVEGRSVSLLKGERTALNFLQRLSGIATTTRHYVQAVKGTRARILDTRKTTPGLRLLEKYAVRMGGGRNHRSSLSDMVLIKDNHLMLVSGITQAVVQARASVKPGVQVEVEVTNFRQAREAVEVGADKIMLDNMSGLRMKTIIDWVQGRATIEASGGVTLANVRRIALLGVDEISVGSLTHSYHSVDISLEFLS
ncbi:MAG: nicotinate-nucleotide diphosphorylase (carboxylating) [Candidatus Aminicenantes bacterium RBG_13_63_10]|nr:MAG: nicotinate-nucleotide diphosphorylase (carboxylating) [Candidatus Aminicenantes bacterium RBG_13_63_10]